METPIESAVKVFEEIENIRKALGARLTHLSRNRRCLDCGKDWMPRSYEPCPECNSTRTKIMRRRRKCSDCGHIWQPSPLGVCPWCHGTSSEANPRDDPYARKVALPRLKHEEEFYEEQLRKMVADHPVWKWAKQVKGAGLTTVGRLISKTDITKVNSVSQMWAHCGLGLNVDGLPQRKRAGQRVNYDVKLQSNCVMLGESLIKQADSYYQYYLKQKDIHSDLPRGHCHNRAFRHMIKLFVSHFWQIWREAEGLPAPLPYAFGILKHDTGSLISPWDMVKPVTVTASVHKVIGRRRRASRQ